MSKECEYRTPATEVSEAIKRQGVPEGVCGCESTVVLNLKIDRLGKIIHNECHFPNVTVSSECPYILFENEEIDEDQFYMIITG